MTHVYAADPNLPPDHRGDGRCTCGLPKANATHTLPPAPDEQRRQRARYDPEEVVDGR